MLGSLRRYARRQTAQPKQPLAVLIVDYVSHVEQI